MNLPAAATLTTVGGTVAVTMSTDGVANVERLRSRLTRLHRRQALRLNSDSGGLVLDRKTTCLGYRRNANKIIVSFPRGSGNRCRQRLQAWNVEVDDRRTVPRKLESGGDDPCGLRQFVRKYSCGVIDCLGSNPSDARVIYYLVTRGICEGLFEPQPRPRPNLNENVAIARTFVVVSNRPRSFEPAESGENHSGQSTLEDGDPSQRLARQLRNQGVRTADLFAGDSWEIWKPGVAEQINLAIANGECENWTEAEWNLAKDTPVVIGSWHRLRNLCDGGGSPDLIVVCEPLTTLSKPARETLPYLPNDTRMVALVRDYVRLPRVSRGVIRAAFGKKRLTVGELTSKVALPNVVPVTPPRFKKPLKTPQNCGSEAERTQKLSEAVVKHSERNREVARVALDAVRDPVQHSRSNLPPLRADPIGRIAIVATDDRHVVELLHRLPPNWVGLVEDDFDIASLPHGEHIKNRVVRPGDTRQHQVKLANGKPRVSKASSFANQIVVSRRRVRAADHRSIYVQADASCEPLRFSMSQLSRSGLDDPPLLIDIADAWPPSLARRTRSRKAMRKSVGWFGGSKKRQGAKTGGRKIKKTPGGHAVTLIDRRTRLDRATATIEQYRKVLDAPLLRTVANQEVLVGMLASLGLPEHGHAAGPDEVRTTDICVSDLSDIADDIGTALHVGEWKTGGERHVEIPKDTNGEFRPLDIPNVDNRAVQKAMAETVQSYLASPAGASAANTRTWKTTAGYSRRGRGQLRMLADLKSRFDEGDLPIAVVFDIRKAFERVRIDDVLRACGPEGHDLRRTGKLAEQAASLQQERESLFGNDADSWREYDSRRPQKAIQGFDLWQKEQVAFWDLFNRLLRGGRNRDVGISQGGPLSPLAMELVLDVFLNSPLQGELSKMTPFWFGRYVDDGLLLVPDRESGLRAVQVIEELLASLGLEMKSMKDSQSRVVDLTVGEETSIVGNGLYGSDSGLAYRFPSGSIETASDSVASLLVTADSYTRVRSFV